MKIIQLLIFILLSTCGFPQTNSLFKTWIDKNNETFIITDSVVFSDIGHMGLIKSDYRLSNDTLFLIEYQWADTKQFPKETDYRIFKVTPDSLFLIERKKWLGEYTGDRDTLILLDSTKLKSQVTGFTKLLFQVSYLSSAKIRSKLEIDISGNVYFWDELKKKVYYHIKLDVRQVDSLTMLLSQSRVENLRKYKLTAGPIDSEGYALTVVCKNAVIRRTTIDPPYLAWPLFDYLYILTTTVSKNENISKRHTFIE